MSVEHHVLKMGTRGSLLARMQSQQVADRLMQQFSGLTVETVIVKTTGDVVQDRTLADLGGKGLFTKELELALIDGRIDFAVHSFKDVPVTMPLVDVSSLSIVASPVREEVRDVLVTMEGVPSISELKQGAKVGTGSPRRKAQLLAKRPDLVVEGIRGNIDTRLKKLASGEFHAILLAAAGVKRANLWNAATMKLLATEEMIPAAGQGALAIQCRSSDDTTRGFLQQLNDRDTFECVAVERDMVRQLNGDCHSPIGVWAHTKGTLKHLHAAVDVGNGLKFGFSSGEDWQILANDVLNQIT